MELRDYVKVIRARFWLVVASVAVVTLVAAAVSLSQKPSYQGVALVLVTQQDSGSAVLGTPQPQESYQPGRDDVATQVEVIQSSRIAEEVIRTLHLDETADHLLARVTASADTGTNNITIVAIDPSAAGAARVANAFAAAYVAWSRDNESSSMKTAADDVQRRLAQAQAQIVAIEATATRSGVSQVRLEAARTLYSTLADKLQQLQIAEQLATGMGSVLSSAAVDPVPVSPRPTRDVGLGLAIGLLGGLGMVFVVEQLDTRIKTAEQAATIYGAPILANIPLEKVGKTNLARLTLTNRADSPAAEAYRMMRNNLDFVNFDKGIKTVLITSAVPNEGKSTVAANLAAVLAQAGNKVALVVCDFYLPAAERFFGLDNSIGLSNVLVGSHELAAALQHPKGVDNLAVLTAGVCPPNPSALLGSAAMSRLLLGLRESFDWVILDSAPLLAAADAAAMARWVDGVLVVVRVGVSRRDAARAGSDQLKNVGARVLGVAAWGPMDKAVVHGYYGYANRAAH
jgi:succinoglycan biosynthesis transport protein ExoP